MLTTNCSERGASLARFYNSDFALSIFAHHIFDIINVSVSELCCRAHQPCAFGGSGESSAALSRTAARLKCRSVPPGGTPCSVARGFFYLNEGELPGFVFGPTLCHEDVHQTIKPPPRGFAFWNNGPWTRVLHDPPTKEAANRGGALAKRPMRSTRRKRRP